MTGGAYSIPEVQRLLSVLAAGRCCAEIGTAFGIGAAAIASTAASLVTVEIDPDRVAKAREALASFGNVEVLEGDWRDELPPQAPFELLFLDGGNERTIPGSSISPLSADSSSSTTSRRAETTSTRDASSGWAERCLWSRRRS